jgi:ketosteroid isomerase-like protein
VGGFLVAVVVPSIREQAIQAERAGASSVRPRLLAEPQVFAEALPFLDQTDPSNAVESGSGAHRENGRMAARVAKLHDGIRKSWAVLVASFPPAIQEKQESVFHTGYDAFQRGDLGAMQRWFAPDAVLVVPGRTPYSGTYRGLAEILALLAHASDRLGIASPELTELVPDGDALQATFTTTVHSKGRSMAIRFRQRFWFNDEGQIVRSILTFEDEQQLDTFFGTP